MATLTLKKDIERIRATLDHNRTAMRMASKRHLVRWYGHVLREYVLDDDLQKKGDAKLKNFCFPRNVSPFASSETIGELDEAALHDCLDNDVSTNWIDPSPC